MFPPESVTRDSEGRVFARRCFVGRSRHGLVTLDTRFSTGWCGVQAVALMANVSSWEEAHLHLAVDETAPEYRTLVANAKQENPTSARRTLQNLATAQAEEGAGLEEPLELHVERHLARLAMAHIVGQRGFSLTDSPLLNAFMEVTRNHTPSQATAQHPAFNPLLNGINPV